ncbi:hypothetical protein L6452_34435 [Arctium lappa]|uniref:Uncharacterized protein n=1 Tax=Arctium lappa TaxID=4217 RepID=A0ACB8YIG4_ARCLA|nr:hypothetical protein L6452_34435 [Arctium lappa]
MATSNGDPQRHCETHGTRAIIAIVATVDIVIFRSKKSKNHRRKPAIKRYASESRVSRYMFHSKYIDDNNFQVKQPKQTVEHIVGDEGRDLSNKGFANGRTLKSMRYGSEN